MLRYGRMAPSKAPTQNMRARYCAILHFYCPDLVGRLNHYRRAETGTAGRPSMSTDAPPMSLEGILQLVERLENGAGAPADLVGAIVKLGRVVDEIVHCTDAQFDVIARYILRITQSIVSPGSSMLTSVQGAAPACAAALLALVRLAVHILEERDDRYALNAIHMARLLTDRSGSIYQFDQRRLADEDALSVEPLVNHWTSSLRRHSFCHWVDPEGHLQAVKVLNFVNGRYGIEVQSQRFGALSIEKAVPLVSPYLSPLDASLPAPLEPWRAELTAGSKVDCLDHVSKWYTAQVVSVTPEGHLRIAYDNWASTYNETLPRTCGRLAPHMSIAVGGRQSAGVEVVFNEEWAATSLSEDSSDQFAVYRGPAMGGDLLPEVINEFGRLSGFDLLLDRVRAVPHASIDELRTIAFIVRQLSVLLTNEFAKQFIEDIVSSLTGTILSLTDVELRGLTKDFLSDFVMILRVPLLRISGKATAARRLDEFELDVALKRFRSPIVEKQLNGMEFLHDTMHVCKNNDMYSRSCRSGADGGWAAVRWQWLDSHKFIVWMDEHHVWEDAFGEHAHPQLMKRASELLRFICREGELTFGHLDLIWSAIQRAIRWQDEIAAEILYTVLDEISFDLSPEHIKHLLKRVSSVNLKDYVVHTLDLILRLGIDDMTALDLMWNAMQNGSAELSREARLRLESMLNVQSLPLSRTGSSTNLKHVNRVSSGRQPLASDSKLSSRTQFLVRAGLKIQEQSCVIENMRLVQDIASSFPEVSAFYERTLNAGSVNNADVDEAVQQLSPYCSRSEALDYLDHHCQLMASFFIELATFVDRAVASRGDTTVQEDLAASFSTESAVDHEDRSCSFLDHIRIRLQFLRFLLSESSLCLSASHVDMLWKSLFDRAISAGQRDMVLEWFQDAITFGGDALATDAIRYLFADKLCAMDAAYVTPSAYACIEKYFLHVNYVAGRISSAPHLVLSPSCDLDGVGFIWTILLSAVDNRVSSSAIALLNQLFSCHRSVHIRGIMTRMVTFIDSRDVPRLRRLLRLASQCLAEIPWSQTDNPSHGHSRLSDGKDGHLPDELSSVSFRMTFSGQTPWLISQSARSTVRYLRVCIADRLGVDPVLVRLFVNGAELSPSLDDRVVADICSPAKRIGVNGGSHRRNKRKRQVGGACGYTRYSPAHPIHLMVSVRHRELGGAEGIVGSAPSSALQQQPQSALLGTTGRLTDVAVTAVSKLFNSFSAGAPSFSIDQLATFVSLSAVARGLSNGICRSASQFLEEFGEPDGSGSRIFNLNAFINLYTKGAERFTANFVWNEIKSLAAKGFVEGCGPEGEGSPRDILSSSDEYFGILFRALELGDDRLSGQVWRLLMGIPSNPSLKHKIVDMPLGGSEPDWSRLFDASSPFRLMYSLQIVQNFVSQEHTAMDEDVVSGLYDDSTDYETDAGDADSISSSSKSSSGDITGSVLQTFPAAVANNADVEDENARAINDWSSSFFASGGLRHLYNVLLSAEKLNSDDDPALFCLALLLKTALALLKMLRPGSNNGLTGSPIQDAPPLGPGLMDWLQLDRLHDRALNIVERMSATERSCYRGNAAWAPTCVVHFALSLWLWCATTVPELVLTRIRNPEVTSIVHKALTCRVKSIRDQTRDALYILCQRDQSVHVFVLDYLISLLHQVESAPCGQFFSLLKQLLSERFKAAQSISPEAYASLVQRFVVALAGHTSTEAPLETLSASSSDELLLGILDTLLVFCSAHPSLCDIATRAGAVQILLDDCLFGLMPKCRSAATRRTAFACVTLICSSSPEAYSTAIASLLRICSPASPEESDDACIRRGFDYEPEALMRSTTGYAGLINQGTTCYMNALCSQLFMIPKLRKGLIEAKVIDDDGSLSDTLRHHRALLFELQKLMANMALSASSAYCTASFCSSYLDESGRPIDVRVQQDAQEFFNVLVDRIESALKGSAHESLLKDTFGGHLCNQMLCQGGCNSVREQREEFSNVSLQVKGFRNLAESLDAYIAGEKLSGVNCDSCGTRSNTTFKRVVLDDLPNTLIFHLKRFELNFETFMNEKLNNRFEFPLRVNMEPYTKRALTPQLQSASSEGAVPEQLDYELAGVIIHIGTADAGHYYSYIRDRSAPMPAWLEFNDQIVRRFSIDKLGDEAFGGEDNMKNAYMLVYERVRPSTDEAPAPVGMQCNVPEKILEEITVSNNRFFRDRQLFDSTSVSFIREVLSLNATEPISSQPMVLKLATRFALDVLARSVSGAADACTILAQLRVEASVDVDIAKWFLREFGSRILVLSDFLLNCRDKNTREAFGSVLSVCLETVSAHETPPIPANTPPLPPYSSPIQHEADEEGIPSSSSGEIPRTLCQEVVFSLMRLVDTASRHWVRFHQLFAVLLRWAESGPYARQYLVRLSAVARLGHLTLGRDSQLPGYPKHTTIMGNRIVQPDLHTVPPTSLPGPLWALTDLDLIIVNCELFYERALMNGGDVSGVVDILVHRSYEYLPYLQPVNKIIIDGVIKANADQVKPYFDLFHGIVQIADSLQAQRIMELMNFESGVSYQIRAYSAGHAAFTVNSIAYMLRSMDACEPLAAYMAVHRHQWEWMLGWMQRAYESQSYHHFGSGGSPSHGGVGRPRSVSSSPYLVIIEQLRRHLQVPFVGGNVDDHEYGVDSRPTDDSSSSESGSARSDEQPPAARRQYHADHESRRVPTSSPDVYREERRPSRSRPHPLNSSADLEGAEQDDAADELTDVDNNSEDCDTASVRSTGSSKKRRTGHDLDRSEEEQRSSESVVVPASSSALASP
ncbi:unnamed protein product (mitochondrion) [Plasmodiophora brassicae]|uniref:ubiquitinyl hydrolase 1 n=1 Tax=Plasmodiophora brassicae TaxID=37360 RepID=A0A3P3YG12_PLABS|nr:unnamed protein product [Plasmodiophora brassicae]